MPSARDADQIMSETRACVELPECMVCGARTTHTCKRCWLAPYCSDGCQRADWPRHGYFCATMRRFAISMLTGGKASVAESDDSVGMKRAGEPLPASLVPAVKHPRRAAAAPEVQLLAVVPAQERTSAVAVTRLWADPAVRARVETLLLGQRKGPTPLLDVPTDVLRAVRDQLLAVDPVVRFWNLDDAAGVVSLWALTYGGDIRMERALRFQPVRQCVAVCATPLDYIFASPVAPHCDYDWLRVSRSRSGTAAHVSLTRSAAGGTVLVGIDQRHIVVFAPHRDLLVANTDDGHVTVKMIALPPEIATLIMSVVIFADCFLLQGPTQVRLLLPDTGDIVRPDWDGTGYVAAGQTNMLMWNSPPDQPGALRVMYVKPGNPMDPAGRVVRTVALPAVPPGTTPAVAWGGMVLWLPTQQSPAIAVIAPPESPGDEFRPAVFIDTRLAQEDRACSMGTMFSDTVAVWSPRASLVVWIRRDPSGAVSFARTTAVPLGGGAEIRGLSHANHRALITTPPDPAGTQRQFRVIDTATGSVDCEGVGDVRAILSEML